MFFSYNEILICVKYHLAAVVSVPV